jgi:acetyl esterase
MSLAITVQSAVLRALMALPRPVKRLVAGSPIRRDGLELDLDAQLVVRLDRLNPRPEVQDRTPQDARQDLRDACAVVAGPRDAMAEVRRLDRARLYVPHGDTGAVLVYYHGGGWVVGDLDSHDAPCRALAAASGARVLSVDYRLAPEHPWPAPLEDALAAFERGVELAGDPSRVAVGGDSAGGHLAAWVALRAEPAFQLLIYPATDIGSQRPSKGLFGEGFLLTKPNMDYYEAQLLRGGAGAREVSPLHADDLAQAAPAMVVTAGFDPLRDEGEAYAEALREAGVPVILRRHVGQVHGFVNMTAAGPGPREAIAEMGGALRAALSLSLRAPARSPAK